jgi:hypothetical protein
MLMTSRKLFIPVLLAVLSIGVATPAFALEGTGSGTQQQRIQERKQELRSRLEQVKADRTTRLEQRRLEVCQKREERINAIFTKGIEQNGKQLAVFQSIEEKVKAFYEAKGLSAEGYDAAVANADEKEAAAIAAIDTSAAMEFDCETTDGQTPGKVIKEAMQARHAALKEYRTAIKDLILVVKKGHGQQHTPAADSSSDETTREGE